MDTNMQSTTGTAPPSVELNALLNRLLDEAEGETADASSPADTPTAASPTPSPAVATPLTGGGGLGSLLTSPAMLSVLPTLAENVAPLLGALSGGVGSSATRPHTVDRHTALLCAVKPYLSPRRQEAAETVIRLCRIWDALERSGISLSGLLSGLDKAIPAGQNASAEGGKEVT